MGYKNARACDHGSSQTLHVESGTQRAAALLSPHTSTGDASACAGEMLRASRDKLAKTRIAAGRMLKSEPSVCWPQRFS